MVKEQTMINTDAWEKVLQLKDRVAVIKYELARLNRYMHNPFENKGQTSDKRKELWEKAAKKKGLLERELIDTNKQIVTLVNQNKKRARRKKK